MKPEQHKKQLQESFSVLQECIEKGITSRQRTIGFHTSAASADMLELLLHKHNLINPGWVLKHDLFTSKRKARETLGEFPQQQEILKIICSIERKRNILCYGKIQSTEIIEEVLHDFNILRTIFREMGIDEK